MATYIDTCVAISYYLQDSRYEKAKRILKEVENDKPFCISPYTILEFYSVLARRRESFRILPGLEKLSPEAKIRSMISRIINDMNLKIPFPDEPKVEDFMKTKIFHKFLDAIRLAVQIQLPTGDLVHVAYALQLKEKGSIRKIISIDDEWKKRKGLIEQQTGLTVICNE